MYKLSQIGEISPAHFRDITKRDLLRGDILLMYESEPSSDNHTMIQESQRRADLNNVDDNCGMAEIVHAGIILRDDVEEAESNFRELGPKDHSYMSERGGIGTTNALRAIGSAVPAGTSLVYRIKNKSVRHIFVEDAKAKEGVAYSSMELGTSLKGSDFDLPDGLINRNIISHILAVYRDKDRAEWANRITVDAHSDDSELRYAIADEKAEAEGRRKKGPGAACSTFIVKGLQAAYGAVVIAKADAAVRSTGHSRASLSAYEKARRAVSRFPHGLNIDAKRNAPKTLQHLLETVEINGEKMFERVGKIAVSEMAYPERQFDAVTGAEIHQNFDPSTGIKIWEPVKAPKLARRHSL